MAPAKVLLLILILCCSHNPFSVAPAEVSDQDFEKPGFCLISELKCRLLLPSGECEIDKDCPGDEKCCVEGCTPKCMPPISSEKPGKCPIVNTLKPCATPYPEQLCTDDYDCLYKRKCCFNGCTWMCLKPWFQDFRK